MRKATLKLRRVKVNGSRFWQVIVPKPGGGRERKTFKDRKEAQRYHDEILKSGRTAIAPPISYALRAEAAKCSETLEAFGKTITDATSFYIDHLKAISASKTVADAVIEFQAAAKDDGASARYLLDLHSRLGRFAKDFGSRYVAEIRAKEIEEWLRGLTKKDSREKLGPVSRNTFRRRLTTFFKYCKLQEWCAAVPMPEKKRAKEETAEEVGVLTPNELSALLKAAAADTLPYWCIGAFGGLRASEIRRLDWSDIDLTRKIIIVRAKASKTASRRIVEIQPNLLKWLAPYRGRSGKVTPKNLRKKCEADRRRAKLAKWLSNALRNSYASYHLSQFQNAAVLALQLGHTSQKLIFQHYAELVLPEDSARYWAIEPETKDDKVIQFETAAP